VADVFAYVTDPAELPSWQMNTVSAVPDGGEPVGLGTRLREVHRGAGGKELESLVEVSEFERLAQPILRIALKRQFEDHCKTLKRVLERR
jgi:hypothetical protein